MLLAEHMMRPYSRKYDKEEHTYPTEMDEVVKLLAGGRSAGSSTGGASAAESCAVVNGGNMAAVIGLQALAWGDLGLFLGMPANGLGNAAIQAVGTLAQREKYGGSYAAMCITEPGTGSDSANIATTAVRDGDEWVLNGEKIYVTSGQWADTLVVWQRWINHWARLQSSPLLWRRGRPVARLRDWSAKWAFALRTLLPLHLAIAVFQPTTFSVALSLPPMLKVAKKAFGAGDADFR